jgi:hypothetical protein
LNEPGIAEQGRECQLNVRLARIGIAHAGKGELSAADGSQQLIVGMSKGVESAIGAATVTDRLTDSGCLLSKRSCTGHTSKGFEITVIGLMGDLGSSVKIGYAAAQSHSFGALFESGSDLSFKERMNFANGPVQRDASIHSF